MKQFDWLQKEFFTGQGLHYIMAKTSLVENFQTWMKNDMVDHHDNFLARKVIRRLKFLG